MDVYTSVRKRLIEVAAGAHAACKPCRGCIVSKKAIDTTIARG